MTRWWRESHLGRRRAVATGAPTAARNTRWRPLAPSSAPTGSVSLPLEAGPSNSRNFCASRTAGPTTSDRLAADGNQAHAAPSVRIAERRLRTYPALRATRRAEAAPTRPAPEFSSKRTMDVTDDQNSPRFLVGTVLHELSVEAQTLLLLAEAVEDRATGIPNNAHPQKLREMAALVKSSAPQPGMAAANLVGAAERLGLVTELVDVDEATGGELLSWATAGNVSRGRASACKERVHSRAVRPPKKASSRTSIGEPPQGAI
jgi:hypothetical protein